MTTTRIPLDTPPLRVARDATRKLNVQEKAQLLTELAQEIAAVAPITTVVAPDTGNLEVRAKLKAFIGDFHAMYPDADVAGQIAADRRARETVIAVEEHDVHA